MLAWLKYACYYGIECIKYGIFYKEILAMEHRKQKVFYPMAVFMWILFSTIFTCLGENENQLISYILFIVIESFLCVQVCWYKLIAIAIWSCAVIGIADSATGMMLSLCMSGIDVNTTWLEKYIASFLTIVFLKFVGKIVKKKNYNMIEKIQIRYYVLFILIGFAESIMLGFFRDSVISVTNFYNKVALSIVFIIAGIGVLLQMAMVFWLAVSKNVYKERDILNQYYLNMQKQYYQHLEERERETRKFRHDERNHLYYIRQLGEKKEHEKLVKYIDQLWKNLECFSKEIRVNNGIVDAILNRYADMAKEAGVSMEIKGCMPKECFIDEFDLCTVFSNLLSNALEAAKETQEKLIQLWVRYDEKMLYIYEENTFLGERQVKHDRLYTKKKNIEYHGYGMINMQDSIEKYAGSLDIEIEGQTCKIFIVMKNQKL